MGSKLHWIVVAIALAGTASGHAAPPDAGLTRHIAEIRSFAAQKSGALWPGLDRAPFDMLVVDETDETLFCRNPIPSDFKPGPVDGVTGCRTGTRGRSWIPPGLLAAMPVFGPPSTIVMGTPKTTKRSEADWTRTILHEHFHQWQDSLPGIYDRIDKLDLQGDDKTGMWMLNFAFPYGEAKTAAVMAPAARALAAAVDARGTPRFRTRLKTYLRRRNEFAAAVGERNWRYAEFELWKEGVARWTEIQLGKRFPDAAVKASAVALERKSRAWLDKPDIAGSGREFVYPYGTAEAMLLEACGPAWRRAYPKQLALGPLLETAAKTCRR